MNRYTAANDNKPRHADEFGDDLKARRAWLDGLPKDYKPVMAWPTLERLSRLASPDAAQALYRYKELMQPARITAANDNDPDGPEMDAEMRHEVRPTVDEMLQAASVGSRTFVRSERTADGWQIVHRQEARLDVDGSNVLLGNLTFREGKLTSWGTTTRGKDLKPVERQRTPKGAARPARRESDIRFLLPANDNTPILKGAYWFGGRKGKKGITTRPDIGDHDAAVEMARNQRRNATRLALGNHAWVLDAAITDSTARDIGELMGATGKTAERRGIAAINEAIKELQKIAA
ncbi:MAG: hypothetical protein KKG78_02325 [Alphaproteobacteria bacterium]|nr:hypothetical protein [Alphaproteobacteria bacterium]